MQLKEEFPYWLENSRSWSWHILTLPSLRNSGSGSRILETECFRPSFLSEYCMLRDIFIFPLIVFLTKPWFNGKDGNCLFDIINMYICTCDAIFWKYSFDSQGQTSPLQNLTYYQKKKKILRKKIAPPPQKAKPGGEINEILKKKPE